MRCIVRYNNVSSNDDATQVKVVPHKFVGSKEVVPLECKKVVRPFFVILIRCPYFKSHVSLKSSMRRITKFNTVSVSENYGFCGRMSHVCLAS